MFWCTFIYFFDLNFHFQEILFYILFVLFLKYHFLKKKRNIFLGLSLYFSTFFIYLFHFSIQIKVLPLWCVKKYLLFLTNFFLGVLHCVLTTKIKIEKKSKNSLKFSHSSIFFLYYSFFPTEQMTIFLTVIYFFF